MTPPSSLDPVRVVRYRPQEQLLRALGRLEPRQLRALGEQLSALVDALEVDAGTPGMFFEGSAPRRRSARRAR